MLNSISSFSFCIQFLAGYKPNGLTRGSQMKFSGGPAVFKVDLKLIAMSNFAGNFGCTDITTVKCSMKREESSLHL